ncbi:RlpA-like double-psi beta-barrel-protein domain-containing protein-containing protein [Thelonectria olida]|uniref:RlpA-like double-psi beta-barrel-protein domain-containing protein-containing protein n=1 Tax=Thelonectria olida TaxID=1576542 RepID=A0A9P8WCU2_9HYPO|nr:RlpA-like double-psi beta-barrel-protein domain-containing protein-containing protein [Thelonectria olida]
MKFFYTALLAAPAVMGRACKVRTSKAAAVSTVVTSAATSATIAPIKVSTAVANDSEEETAVVSSSTPKTTLSTAIVVSTTKSSTSAAAAASTAASETVADDETSTDSSSDALGTTAYTGQSTFYGGNLSGGNCMFTTYTLPSNMYGTAYSGAVWNNAAKCGACIEVTGPSGTIKAMIVDQCPECAEGHLDLFPDAFTAVGGTDGIVSTSYKFVECGISSPLILHNKEGTSQYWFSIQVVNHNEPVASLEVSTDGGSSWVETERKDYNFFENTSGFGVSSVSVRVTSTTGKTVTVSNVGVTAGAQYTATSNF